MLINGDSFRLQFFQKYVEFTWGVDMWLGTASAADIVIASSMCVLLHSSRTGIKRFVSCLLLMCFHKLTELRHFRTDRLINKLMMYSLETGALTTVVEILSMATVRPLLRPQID
jgi:hypothetical protein